MRFSADWIADGENASAEERATLCALKIHIGDLERNVAEFFDLDAKQVFDGIVLPAVHLADGIASHWWQIFGGRDVTHRILPWRTGFALPDLRFEFDGSTLHVSCEPSGMANPHLVFPHGGEEYLRRSDAERALCGFVDEVVTRLRTRDVIDAPVALMWGRVQESRADVDERAFCEAAGALGSDPYAIPDADALLIQQAGALFEGEALIEFLAGMRDLPDVAESRLGLVGWVTKRRPQERSRLPELPAVAKQIAGASRAVIRRPPWNRGKRAAKALRAALEVSGTESISVKDVSERLGGTRFGCQSGPRGIFALVSRDEDHVHVHLRSRGREAWARSAEKFAFARAVGDAVCFPETSRSAINDLHRAERQAVGRAFAAEFAAPADAVLERWRDGQEVDEIAGYFGVSSKVVDHTIEDSGRYATH